MTTHERAHELAAIAMDFDLDEVEHAELNSHLQSCSACRAHASSLAGDAVHLASLPSIDAPARVRRAVTMGRSLGLWVRFGPAVGALLLVVAIGVPMGAGALFFRGFGIPAQGGGGVPVVTPGPPAPPTAAGATSAPTADPSPTPSPSARPAP